MHGDVGARAHQEFLNGTKPSTIGSGLRSNLYYEAYSWAVSSWLTVSTVLRVFYFIYLPMLATL